MHRVLETSPFLAMSMASTKVSIPGALGSTFPSGRCSLSSLFYFYKFSNPSSNDWVSILLGEEGFFGWAHSLSFRSVAYLFFLDMDGDFGCLLTLIVFYSFLSPIGLLTSLLPTLTVEGWGYSFVTVGASSTVSVCLLQVVLDFFIMNSSQLLPWQFKVSNTMRLIRPWLVTHVFGCVAIFTAMDICLMSLSKM